ncbi:hypothetical protein WJX74_003461 [Apatococcus lobatus]|uniref:Uncharacterized protein n=1 Tax=Apatococcus lobatus TaxID=904363 RepID=A0AAW1RYJ4_9CHLO
MSGAVAASGSTKTFQYGLRMGMALLPNLLLVAELGGKAAIGVLLVGAMVAYILDSLQSRMGALGAVWISLGLTNLACIVNLALPLFNAAANESIMMSVLLAFAMGLTLFLTGIWATLNFRWVGVQYPLAVLAMERLLMAASFPAAAILQSWALVGLVGPALAPFYQMGLLAGLFHSLLLPLGPSMQQQVKPGGHVPSWQKRARAIGGAEKHAGAVQSTLDGALGAALITALPCVSYLAAHAPTMPAWRHLWSLVLLFCLPCLYLLCTQDGLWWLPLSTATADRLRRMSVPVVGLGALAGLEGRVLLPAFGSYLAVPAPWSTVLVTIALFGSASVTLVLHEGWLSPAWTSPLSVFGLMGGGMAGGWVAGMPFPIISLPVIAGSALGCFFDTPNLLIWLVFVASALGTGAWFLWHHFWFLEVALAGGAVSLQRLCIGIFLAFLPALIIPGFLMTASFLQLVGPLLIGQALLVTWLEAVMLGGEHGEELDGTTMYPPILVLLTSGLGVLMTHRLASAQGLDSTSAWLLRLLHLSKLSLILIPQMDMVLRLCLLAVVVTLPQELWQPLRAPERAWKGPLLAALVPPALLLAASWHHLDALLHLILPGQLLPTGLWVGVLLLALAACWLPLLLYADLQDSHTFKQVVSGTAAAGLALVIIQPPFPFQGAGDGLLGDEDDAAVWGSSTARSHRPWHRWLLLAAVAEGLLALRSQIVPQPASRRAAAAEYKGPARPAWGPAIGGGVLLGLYLARELFPSQAVLQVVVLASSLAVIAFLVLLRAHTEPAARLLLPWLAIAWAALLALGLLAQALLPLPHAAPESRAFLYPDAGWAYEQDQADEARMSLLGLFAAEALLLSLAIKLKMAAFTVQGATGMSLDDDYNGLGLPRHRASDAGGLTAQIRGVGGEVQSRLRQQGLTLAPLGGNVATLACYAFSQALARHLTEDPDLASLPLAALLLLLSQDPVLLRWLKPGREYFPAVASTTLVLGASSIVSLLTELRSWSLQWWLWQATCLVQAISLHYVGMLHHWRDRRQQKPQQSLSRILCPMGLFAATCAGNPAIRYFAIAGLAMNVTLAFGTL